MVCCSCASEFNRTWTSISEHVLNQTKTQKTCLNTSFYRIYCICACSILNAYLQSFNDCRQFCCQMDSNITKTAISNCYWCLVQLCTSTVYPVIVRLNAKHYITYEPNNCLQTGFQYDG